MSEDKSLAYLKSQIGCYALTEKIRGDMGVEPKNMLIRLDQEEIAEHRQELVETEASCVKTSTGARFCLFTCKEPKFEIEAVEMVLPSWKYAIMAERREEPTLEEARKKYRNAFLVVSCEPESFCKKQKTKKHLS